MKYGQHTMGSKGSGKSSYGKSRSKGMQGGAGMYKAHGKGAAKNPMNKTNPTKGAGVFTGGTIAQNYGRSDSATPPVTKGNPTTGAGAFNVTPGK